jgi:hypothetical protein
VTGNGSGHDFVHLFAFQAEPVGEALQNGGEHIEIGFFRIDRI